MKRLVLLSLICFLVGCSQPQNTSVENKNVNQPEIKTNEPANEIEQAVRQYFSKPRPIPSNINATPEPPAKVLGVSIIKSDKNYFEVDVEIEFPNGKKVVRDVICQRFTSEGKTYWKVSR